jgi:NitT/TauT family transport system permease protein
MPEASEQSLTALRAPVRSAATVKADARWWSQVLQLWVPRLVGYGLVVGLWQAASGRWVPAFTLPPPAAMTREMWELVASGVFWVHFSATIRTIVVGYALAFVVGLSVGVMMVWPWVDAFCRKWVVTLLNTPGLVFVLVATMIFGFNPLGPITAIVVTSFPFVTVNIAEGVRAIPKDLIDMGTAFGVPPQRRVRQIVIPFLAPYTFAALRYGFSIAWKIATFAELFGSSRGVGFMIRREFELFSMTGMLAWILLFCAFALLLEVLLQAGMRRYFRWRPHAAI